MRRSLALAALGAGGEALTACSSAAVQVGTHLPRHLYETLDAVGDTVVPHGGGFPLGARDVDLAAQLDAFIASQPAGLRLQLEGALWVVEFYPVVTSGSRFGSLSLAERTLVFREMNASRFEILRQVAQGLTRAALYTFYNTPSVWPHVGYDGPLVDR